MPHSSDAPSYTDVRGAHVPSNISFRPSATSIQAHQLVVHPDHNGKEPQSLLELIPHLPNVALFLPSPPVLRGLYDFGFDQGLQLMHCLPLTKATKREKQELAVNMTDFSIGNGLRKAPKPTGKTQLTRCLRGLKTFARYFYNQPTYDLIDAASVFIDGYTGIDEDDANSWTNVASWISEKFGNYRSFLLCDDQQAAAAVHTQIHRYDESLAEWLDILQVHYHPSHSKSERKHNDDHRRHDKPTSDRPQRKSTIPRSFRDKLPTFNGKQLCMKFLSVTGCTGKYKGGCFDPNRAHFVPKADELNEDARAIINKFGGLDPKHSTL